MIRIIEFKTDYIKGPEGTKAVDKVLLAPIGADHTKTQTWRRVEKIRPPETDDPGVRESLSYKDMAAKWSVVGPAYEAWRNGQEIPETGTPLAAWAALSPEQAKLLKAQGVRTVEDIAELSDASLSALPFPNARKLPDMAQKYLSGESAAQKDARIDDLEAKLAAALEMLEEQQKPKRGPGRPKKQPEADAA